MTPESTTEVLCSVCHCRIDEAYRRVGKVCAFCLDDTACTDCVGRVYDPTDPVVPKEGLACCDDCRETWHPLWPKYVNVYHVEQCYGGPEEGGWYYDSGEPLESHRVDNVTGLTATNRKLTERYMARCECGEPWPCDREEGDSQLHQPADRELVRGRTSAAGGYDIVTVVEHAFAAAYPPAKPHYE